MASLLVVGFPGVPANPSDRGGLGLPGGGATMKTSEALFDTQAKFWRLRRSDLLDTLSDADVKELGALCHIRIIERGAPVYGSGQASDTVYYVESGTIKLCRVAEDQREVNVGVVGPGELFGELAMADEAFRSDAAVVLEDAVVCGFDSREFEKFLHGHPRLALRVTKLIGERLSDVESRIQDILFKDVRTRLAHTMAHLAVKFGEDVPRGRRIALRLTQSDLAQLIGSTRETTSTAFNEFRRDGRVETDGQFIVVRDPESLAAY